MKWISAVFAVVLAGMSWAQQSATTNPATEIPDGTVVKVEAKQNVETKKAKVGDSVKLEATEDGKDAKGNVVRGPDGQVAVPRKTKLLAKVTSVQPMSKESNKEARLSLIVTSAIFPNGKTVPFLGVVMGPFKESGLSLGTGIGMEGRGSGASATAMPSMGGPEVPSGIQGVNLEIDPKLGTVLVGRQNFALENGTAFHVRYVDPSKHQAETSNPPGK